MRFFTRDRELSEEGWDLAMREYHSHLAALAPSLPPAVLDLATERNLHDGLIVSGTLLLGLRTLRMVLRCGDLQVGYYDLELEYRGIDMAALDIDGLAAIVRSPSHELVRDEVDAIRGTTFVHRLRFHPEGEIELRFESLCLPSSPREDRYLERPDDPFTLA